MPTPDRVSRLLALLIPLAACEPGGAPAPLARIDTLHPGLIQVTSPAPTGWTDSARAWHYRVTLRLQPDEQSPGELLQPTGIAVDGWGRIYVVERKPASIKVYDSAGSFVRTIGREGSGPGEFRVAFIAVRGSHLAIQDPLQSRTSLFDTSGTFIRSWNSSCCYWDDIIIDSSSIVYVPSMYTPDSGAKHRGTAHRRFGIDGTSIDTVFVPRREGGEKSWVFSRGGAGSRSHAMMSTGIPFGPRVVKALHPDGGFVIGWTGEYRIRRSRTGEDTTMIITRPWTPDPIPDAMRRDAVEDLVKNAKDMVGEASARNIAKLGDVPTTAPAYQSLRVDLEGNVWARHLIGSDSTRTLYDVYASSGAWLGPVALPAAVPEYGGQFFGAGAIYAVVEDQEGRPMVVRLTRMR